MVIVVRPLSDENSSTWSTMRVRHVRDISENYKREREKKTSDQN